MIFSDFNYSSVPSEDDPCVLETPAFADIVSLLRFLVCDEEGNSAIAESIPSTTTWIMNYLDVLECRIRSQRPHSGRKFGARPEHGQD